MSNALRDMRRARWPWLKKGVRVEVPTGQIGWVTQGDGVRVSVKFSSAEKDNGWYEPAVLTPVEETKWKT